MENRQIDKVRSTALDKQDRRIVEAILKHGDLGKAAKELHIKEADIKARYKSGQIRNFLLHEIEQLLLLEHIPAALKYLLSVVRGDVKGDKERVNVAKTLLDRVGLAAKKARDSHDGDKEMEDMTIPELQEFIAKKESELRNVTPNSAPPNRQTIDWLE